MRPLNISYPNQSDLNYMKENPHYSDNNLSNFEIWGMLITSIYFILGFPTNLLSIIVYIRSQTKNVYIKRLNNRIRRKDLHTIENSLIKQKEIFRLNSFIKKEANTRAVESDPLDEIKTEQVRTESICGTLF